MRLIFALFLLIHGLLHGLGFARAFGLARLPQLTVDISRGRGLAWLAAALLFVASAVGVLAWPRGWWWIGLAAVIVSQLVLVTSWADARFGTIANVVALVGVVLSALAWGPTGLRASYEAEVERRRSPEMPPDVVEADLAHLPPAVARYLRQVGVVGHPRVRDLYVTMRGRIRSGPDAPWMPFVAEQHNFTDPPARLFWMEASRAGVPFHVLHQYIGDNATMRVKVASVYTMVDATGPEMTRAETVTLFNDMCVLAPALLIDPGIAWEELAPDRVRATFTHAGHTIRAELLFNDAGELVDFVSDDRSIASPDGKAFTPARWSTPVDRYASFGPFRLGSRGEARWKSATEDYAYIEFDLTDIRYNVAR